MKRSLLYSVLVMAVAFTAACKKKKNESTEAPVAEVIKVPATYDSYSKMKIGNYWIYGRFQLNADSSLTDLHQYDSCYVEKDTVVGSYTYFKIRKKDFVYNLYTYILQRDSLHYIVRPGGGIVFSSQDFSTVFTRLYNITPPSDTITTVTKKMTDKDQPVTTAAGTFITSNMRTTFVTAATHAIAGVDNPRYMHARYAKNIGLVTETEVFYSGNNASVERRLLRCHFN